MKRLILSAALLCAAVGPANGGETDTRTVITLTPPQRHLVLEEMRQFLAGLQQISAALSREDMETVAAAARAVGLVMSHSVPADLKQALPEAFRKLGHSVHSDFDAIGLDAEALGDAQHTLSQLGETLSKCVSCHAGFRIEEK